MSIKKRHCLAALAIAVSLLVSTFNFGGISTVAADLTLASESALSIVSGNYITGVSESTKASVLLTHFKEASASLCIKNSGGKIISDECVGTGSTVTTAGGTVYTVVQRGDVDGNGIVTSTDYIMIKRLLKGISQLSGAYEKAADTTGNGTIEDTDYVQIKSYFKQAYNLYEKETPILNKVEPKQTKLNRHSVSYVPASLSGQHSGTVISGTDLTLASGKTSGQFISSSINIGTFTRLLTSWNATTNGSKVEISVSVQNSAGQWSGFFSYGVWSSTQNASSSKSASDSFGTMDVDTLSVNNANGNIKVKIALTKTSGTPVVKRVTFATDGAAKASVPAYPASYLNNVAVRSQTAPENGEIGEVICSATTTAMALSYLGTYKNTLTVANGVYDVAYNGYGNWAFNVAYVGECGYTSYLDYYDVDMLKYSLSQGVPVGCSITGTLPGYYTTAGHLVLVVGYKTVNGVDYFIVNDPGIPSNQLSRREYKVSDFKNVWYKAGNLGVCYVYEK